SKLTYIHRRASENAPANVYFVSNQRYADAEVECTFRIEGQRPELWHADTGVIEDAQVYRSDKASTVVPLHLGPAESVFVVFRRPANANHLLDFGSAGGGGGSTMKVQAIAIKKAHYGLEDGRGADVTEIVSQMVKEGN